MIITPTRFVFAVLLTALIPLFWFVQVVKERDDAVRELATVSTERDGLLEAARISGEMLAARDANDLKHTQELKNALDLNKALQRDVALGARRLLVKATCPATPAAAHSGAGGVADAGSAELAADARSDYFTLRDQLALTRRMVLGLQDYIRTVVQRTPAKP